jgi:hypothetical protein
MTEVVEKIGLEKNAIRGGVVFHRHKVSYNWLDKGYVSAIESPPKASQPYLKSPVHQ